MSGTGAVRGVGLGVWCTEKCTEENCQSTVYSTVVTRSCSVPIRLCVCNMYSVPNTYVPSNTYVCTCGIRTL